MKARFITTWRRITRFVLRQGRRPAPCGFKTYCIGSQVQIDWINPSFAKVGFELYRNVNGGAFSLLASPGPANNSLRDDTTSSGNTYSYRLRTVFYRGKSPFVESIIYVA